MENMMEKNIDYKLGQIDSKIENLTVMHEEEKQVRQENHQKIEEISETLAEWKQIFLRIDSWKNGQTLFQNKIMEDNIKQEKRVDALKDEIDMRFRPLEADYSNRVNTDKDTASRQKDLVWNILKYGSIILVSILILFFLVNIKSFYQLTINAFT